MARAPAGPLGNSPRDGRDDFIGEEAEDLKTGAPPRWPPKPKKITRNDFHAKVGGGNAAKRADRASHFRRGGFVSGHKIGGAVAKRQGGGTLDPSDIGPKGDLAHDAGIDDIDVGGQSIVAKNVPDTVKSGPSSPPPAPRKVSVVKSAPTPRPRPAARPTPSRDFPIGGPGSSSFGGGGYKSGGKTK